MVQVFALVVGTLPVMFMKRARPIFHHELGMYICHGFWFHINLLLCIKYREVANCTATVVSFDIGSDHLLRIFP